MVNIGIVVYNIVQYEELIDFFTDYLHCSPHCKSHIYCEWRLPLMHIMIIGNVSHARGCRFDLIYYDNRIPQVDIDNILYQCSYYQTKPRPLYDFLLRLRS